MSITTMEEHRADVERVRAEILAAIEVATAKGYGLIACRSYELRAGRPCCCPLAAVLVARSRLTSYEGWGLLLDGWPDVDPLQLVATELKISSYRCYSIAAGVDKFDDELPDSWNPATGNPWITLGRELRELVAKDLEASSPRASSAKRIACEVPNERA